MARIDVLIKVAQELQKICEFEPPIKTKGKSEKELEKALKEASEALTLDDKLSVEALKLFKELKLTIGKEEKAPGPKEDDEEAEAEVEVEVEEEVEEEKPAKAKKEKKEKKVEEEEVEEEVEVEEEKPAKAKKEKKEKKEKKQRVKTLLGTVADTQSGAIDKVLLAKKGKFVSIDDIAKEAGVKNSRINTHIAFLNKQGRATIESKKEDKLVSYKLVKAGT